MQHLILAFEHSIQDVIPYCDLIQQLKPLLLQGDIGSYLGDDMAIDGGDAEATFECRDAKQLLDFIAPHMQALSFMQRAKVTLVFGEIDSGAESCEIAMSSILPS